MSLNLSFVGINRASIIYVFITFSLLLFVRICNELTNPNAIISPCIFLLKSSKDKHSLLLVRNDDIT